MHPVHKLTCVSIDLILATSLSCKMNQWVSLRCHNFLCLCRLASKIDMHFLPQLDKTSERTLTMLGYHDHYLSTWFYMVHHLNMGWCMIHTDLVFNYHPRAKYDGYVFYRCLSVNKGAGLPQSLGLGPFAASGAISFPGGTPSQGRTGVPPSKDWGTPSPARTGLGYPQTRTVLGYPLAGTGYPLGTGYTAGGMPPAVSRRRSFLF